MTGADRTEPFSPAVAVGIIVVGLLCFAGFIVLFATSRDPNARDGGMHAASPSSVGFSGLVELLRATGTPTLTSRGGLAESASGGLLILTPAPGQKPPPTMATLARRRPVLLILPKWAVSADPDHSGWVQTTGTLPASTVLAALGVLDASRGLRRRPGVQSPSLAGMNGFLPAVSLGPIDRLQVLGRGALSPLVADADGVVLGRNADGLYVLSDPDLLNNAGLADERGAAFAVALIRALADGRPVTFDLSLNGFGRSRDPLRAILEPPLLGATLCAVAAALLAGLLSAVRFGPAQATGRSFELGKTALTGNSAALIARAGREAQMAVPYAELSRGLAARALGLSRRLGPADTVAALDRTRPDGAPRLGVLLKEAEAVRNRAALLTVARALYQFRRELVRGHR